MFDEWHLLVEDVSFKNQVFSRTYSQLEMCVHYSKLNHTRRLTAPHYHEEDDDTARLYRIFHLHRLDGNCSNPCDHQCCSAHNCLSKPPRQSLLHHRGHADGSDGRLPHAETLGIGRTIGHTAQRLVSSCPFAEPANQELERNECNIRGTLH